MSAMLRSTASLSSAFGRVTRHSLSRRLDIQVRAMATAEKPLVILGVPGSLRQGSTNNGMLRAIAKRLPANTTFEILDVSALPLYNDDLWQGKTDENLLPPAVRAVRAKVAAADAYVFSSPEYNFTISSVLKTAIDWCSKNPNVWSGKTGIVIGAGGGAGTARAQAHLRNCVSGLNVHLLNPPQDGYIAINRFVPGQRLFDEASGDLLDKPLEDKLAAAVGELAAFTRKLQA